MKLLIEIKELSNFKSRDKIDCECEVCKKIFKTTKNTIQRILKGNCKNKNRFCSKNCQNIGQYTMIKTFCKNCNAEMTIKPSQKRKYKNHFCSRPCAGTYNSQHRTKGTSRSKLEKWLESKLKIIYPQLNIKYNDTSAILAELDIYIPSLKLAFELNGIFHYEPIFGLDKLTEIQKRDKRKILTCAQNNIELVIIDSSSLKYFKPDNAEKF